MDGKTAVAKVLKKEGVDFIACFPTNPLIEAVAIEGLGCRTVAEVVAGGQAGVQFMRGRGVRVADGDGLENRCCASNRGFESHPLRQF